MKPLALTTGVGPGTGSAVARRFTAAGYLTALIARDAKRLDALARELPDGMALPCDVTDPNAVRRIRTHEGRATYFGRERSSWSFYAEVRPFAETS